MTADISYIQNLQQPLEDLQALFDAQRRAYAAKPDAACRTAPTMAQGVEGFIE